MKTLNYNRPKGQTGGVTHLFGLKLLLALLLSMTLVTVAYAAHLPGNITVSKGNKGTANKIQLIGRFGNPQVGELVGSGENLAIHNKRVYTSKFSEFCGAGDEALHAINIVDVSDPTNPVEIGKVPILANNNVSHLVVTTIGGHEILVTSMETCGLFFTGFDSRLGKGGIRVFDVTDATKPFLLTEITGKQVPKNVRDLNRLVAEAAKNLRGDLVVEANRLGLTQGGDPIDNMSILFPRYFQGKEDMRKDRGNFVDNAQTHGLHFFKRGDNHFLVTSYWAFVGDVRIWNMDDPAKPQLVGITDIAQQHLKELGIARNLVDLNLMDKDDKKLIDDFDLINEIARYKTGALGDNDTGGFGRDIGEPFFPDAWRFAHALVPTEDGNRLYVGGWDAGILLFDISNFSSIQLISQAIDPLVSNEEVSSHSVATTQDEKIVVEGGERFVLDLDGFEDPTAGEIRIWDYSDRENPKLASIYHPLCGHDYTADPDRCDAGFATSFALGYGPHDIKIVETDKRVLVYIAHLGTGFVILDVTNISKPKEIARFNPGGGMDGDFVAQNRGPQTLFAVDTADGVPEIVYMGDLFGGLYIFRVDDSVLMK